MDIKIIYDEARAIREKAEVDAYNQSLKKPVRVVGFMLLTAIIAAAATTIISKMDVVHSVYAGLAIVISVFIAVAFLVVWHTEGERHRTYSANLQYHLATKNKWVKSCRPVTGERWSNYLEIISEDQNYKRTTVEIDISCRIPTKGISQDIVDFTKEDDFGFWHIPYERKLKELEDEIVSWDEDD